VGLPYRYDVKATDADGDPLTYALSGTVPTGMTIDAGTGRIAWTPTAAGTSNGIVITVSDPYGGQATQTMSVTVNADTTAPTVELQLSPNPLALGKQETFIVFGSDNVAVTSLTVTVNGTNLPIDAHGQAFYTPTATGNYTIVATAKDAAGNTATSTQTLNVTNPAGTPPTITLTAPIPDPVTHLDPNITAPTAVTGTVSDDHIGISYTVTVIPFDGSPSFSIGSGSTTTASSLALSNVTFDPTMLANGDYTIEIRATDTDDNLTSIKDQHVSVSGHLKLGREQLSATDLTIPVAGIPLTITRSYDSLNAGKSMDFGYGWRLGFGDAKLEVDLVPGADVGWGGLTAFLDGTRVYVTMPGGEREGFTFMPYQQAYDTFGLIVYWHPYFIPDPGVLDTLTAPDALLDKDPATGDYYSITDAGISTYNPADPNYGGSYTVTDLSGLGSTIDATSGKLLSMKARNNNTLTFSQNAITSNTGKTVTITRDPAGHITAITDPRGNSVKYSYDVNGNLASVTDRAGDPPTQYTYDASHAHYLSTVVDPLGVQQLQVTYDTTGRVSQMKDAKLNPINFGYDTTALTETVTDPSLPSGQQSATVAFNTRGDTTQVTDPTGAQSSATYNNASSNPAAKDLPDTVTQVRRNSDNTTTSFTSSLTYDTKGDMTSTTDPTGATTRATYGPLGIVLTTSDALGNTTTNSYDKNSNLLSTVSGSGVLTNYAYDKNNNLTSIGQPNTGIGQPPTTSKFSYDQYGNLATSTTPTGVTTNFGYNANGDQTGTSYQWAKTGLILRMCGQ
jgi:YD repeat-containing protein